MKKIRVLIIRNAYQQDTGGAEQYSLNLAIALKNQGEYEPILITKHKSIINKCSKLGIKAISGLWSDDQHWTKLYYLRLIYTTIWYMWIILINNITIVHPQSRDDFVFATFAARILNKKVFWTDHADLKYILDRVNHPHPRMQKWILSASKKVESIICVSKNEKKLILNVAPELRNKITIVYNGVFVPKNIRPVKKKGLVVGSNSRLVPEKGISELIEAYANIPPENSSELWIIGGFSNNLNVYKKLARKFNIEKRVKFVGYVDNPNDYVASMDIFVHPSYNEAFSLAIIEACMLGKPIVATNTGGTPEIINKDTGILVEPKKPRELTRAINILINNKTMASSLGDMAKKYSEKNFDFDNIVRNQIIKLYKG